MERQLASRCKPLSDPLRSGPRRHEELRPNRRHAAAVTIPEVASAHDLRRTCADRLEEAGVDPLVIGRIMRHKSYETTRRFYATGNVQRDARRLHEVLTGLTTDDKLRGLRLIAESDTRHRWSQLRSHPAIEFDVSPYLPW